MADGVDTRRRILAAAMATAGERGWNGVTLAGIAARADVSLAELYRHFPTRHALLPGFSRMVDEIVLESREADPADAPRDRLFEVLMRRFDVLAQHRPGVAAVLRDLRLDPLSGALQLPQLGLSMRWMLTAAGIPAGGVRGALKVQTLAALYLSVLRVWLRDESADMARTMAVLDRRLRQAEQLANTFDRRSRAPEPPPVSPEEGGVA